jgi:N utilization substance protein B
MINRILIRIKVVQMLYSYLLTRSEFHLQPAPVESSRDKQYAYSVYQNILLMILELSGYRVSRTTSNPMEALGEGNMLSDNKLARALSANLDIREMMAKGNSGIENFNPVLLRIYSLITKSAVYADYRKKRRPELDDEVTFWSVVINTIIATNQIVVDAARTDENFTLAGFRAGVKMAVDTLRDYNDAESTYTQAKKALNDSLEKAYELYHALLLLPIYFTDMEAERIESAKSKYCPTDEELNPNMRFVENKFVAAMRENEDMNEYLKAHPFSWESDYFMLKDLLDKIRESEIYRNYMEAENTDFAADAELWRSLLRTVVFPSDALSDAMEQRSVYWNDDLAIMGTFVLKTIKHFANTGSPKVHLLPIYKDDEDAKFGPDLFLAAIKNRDTYRAYIDRFINGSNWDPERLAFMDIIILTTAITELLNFPSIPVAVTMNEYVEIANYYSTSRSGQFVNGILFSIANYLKEEGLLTK